MLHWLLHLGGYIFWVMVIFAIIMLIWGWIEQRKEEN